MSNSNQTEYHMNIFQCIDTRKLSLNEVPVWLRDSFLFKNFTEGNELNDTITIDSQFICESTDIDNFKDYIQVISVMSYWRVNQIPYSIRYALEFDIINNIQYELIKESFKLEIYWDVLDVFSRKKVNNIQEFTDSIKAVSYWNLQDDIPDYIIKFIYNTESREFDIIKEQFLKYPNLERFWEKVKVISTTEILNQSLTRTVIELCKYDYYDCLRFFCFRATEIERRNGFQACLISASLGKIMNLKILRENDYPFDQYLLVHTAQGGYIECLRWLHEQHIRSHLSSLPCNGAVKGRQLKCLRFLVENGYVCDEITYRLALETENQEIIEYVRDHMSCRWDN